MFVAAVIEVAAARQARKRGSQASPQGRTLWVTKSASSKGRDDVELGAPRKERFGEQYVGAGCEGAVAEADILLLERAVDLGAETRLEARIGRKHVAGKMGDGGRLQRVEEPRALLLPKPEMVRDEAELAPRGGAGAVVGRSEDGLRGERGRGVAGEAEEQQRLGPRHGHIEIARRGDGRIGEQCPRDRPRLGLVAGQQRERRGVDPGKAVAALAVDGEIGPVRFAEGRQPRFPRRQGKSAVLEQAGPRGALVGIGGAAEAVILEQQHRPLRVAHPREGEHLEVAQVLGSGVGPGKAGDREVVGSDEVAAGERRFGARGKVGAVPRHARPYEARAAAGERDFVRLQCIKTRRACVNAL
jgi:hypothetical protein